MALFFCKNCNTSYNVTKNIKEITEKRIERIKGGKKPKIISDNSGNNDGDKSGDNDNNDDTNSTEATFDTVEDIVDKILGNVPLNVENWDDIDISQIKKTNSFKKLKGQDKDYVVNKLNDLFPKKEVKEDKKDKKDKKNDDDKDTEQRYEAYGSNVAYFICLTCGFYENVEQGTLIYVKSYDKHKEEINLDDYKEICYDKTLPRTKYYECKNKKCITQTQPEKRKAVFKRLKDSYRLIYNCCVCKAVWLN